MTDIVKRLRQWAEWDYLIEAASKDLVTAADEIERLREAFQNYLGHVGCGTAIRCEHCEAARAALREKE